MGVFCIYMYAHFRVLCGSNKLLWTLLKLCLRVIVVSNLFFEKVISTGSSLYICIHSEMCHLHLTHAHASFLFSPQVWWTGRTILHGTRTCTGCHTHSPPAANAASNLKTSTATLGQGAEGRRWPFIQKMTCQASAALTAFMTLEAVSIATRSSSDKP